MAEHHGGPVETGAQMDYNEHEKTYLGFLGLAKYGTLLLVALLAGMSVSLVGSAGILAGILIFFIVAVLGMLLLR